MGVLRTDVRADDVALAPAGVLRGSNPPSYVTELVRGGESRSSPLALGDDRVVAASNFSLISLVAPDCASAGGEELESAACRLYQRLGRLLAEERRYPVRVWNFVPAIDEPAGDRVDRYMAFNAGRHAGYASWAHGSLAAWVPAASAVGAPDGALVVHCLAADAPGVPLENSRQTPAYCYSRRYGPTPPSFARATIVSPGRSPLLLVSGTASIRGEDSVHAGRLAAQLRVTLENLQHIWCAARSREESVAPLTDARVYLPDVSDAPFVLARLRLAFPSILRVEAMQSALCRRELLVEIEAASLPPSLPGGSSGRAAG